MLYYFNYSHLQVASLIFALPMSSNRKLFSDSSKENKKLSFDHLES